MSDSSQFLRVNVSGSTDVGQTRENNEDNFAVFDLENDRPITGTNEELQVSNKGALLIVSDGMGGANAGEVASAMATEIIIETIKQLASGDASELPADRRSCLEDATLKAHRAILENSQLNTERVGMGATVTAMWIWDREAAVVQVGDSRLYRLENDNVSRITHDQSPVGRLLRSGHLTAEQARLHPQRNLLDQALGAGLENIDPDSYSFPLQEGQSYLLCTDGLSDALPDALIHQTYTELTTGQPSDICSRLIVDADTRYGQDNITALLCRVCAE